MKVSVRIGILGSLLATQFAVQAIEPVSPGSFLPDRPSSRRPELPEFLSETPDSSLSSSPVPENGHPPMPTVGPSFVLRGVAFEDNTVFPNQELEVIAKDFVGKKVTLADLEELRYRLTRHYTDQGYINSGVILKSGQQVTDGIVIYQVLEGHLSEVRINGTERLLPDYVRDRIWPDPESPFNIKSLQERFQLLLRDPLFERLNGKLLPGAQAGNAILELDVTRARSYELSFGANNYRPPSTGSELGYVTGVLRNLSGYGDNLGLIVGVTGGANELFANYSVPFTSYDSRLALNFYRSDRSVIEEPLKELNIDSETWGVELGLFHPVYRSLRRTVTLGMILARRNSQTFLLGDPFPFSPGANDKGESRVTALRLSQELVDRTPEQALALRSTFSVGIDALSSTVHSEGRPDSRFFAWLGQTQYARRLWNEGIQLILRGDVQLTNDRLLDLERIAEGGIRTVRGYRENELVRDNGYDVSAELRYPVWRGEKQSILGDLLQIAVFMDYGSAWNKADSRHEELHSVGGGLLWNPTSHISADFYYAHALKKARPKEDHNLQDDGIHFRFSVNL